MSYNSYGCHVMLHIFHEVLLILFLRKCKSMNEHFGCVHAYFAKAESAFWNADSKRRSKTPLIQAIVRAQVNRKGVYMTSFKRRYNVILRSCFHQNQRFALTTIVNAHFGLRSCLFCEGVLKRWFKTPIQNAVHGSTVHASLEKKTIRLPKKACLGILGMFNSGYCSSSSEPERRLYDVI